jgi:hypothetical protein
MAFVNFSLLFGASLLAIPIVLHLVMRQQPKQLVFPAIRFLKQRRETNRRQLQLRHWLLLLLRCLGIALLAAALARPSVHSLQLGNWMLAGVLGLLLSIAGLLTLLSLFQRRGGLVSGGLLLATLLLAGATAWTVRSTLADDRQVAIGNQQAPVAAVLVFDTSPRMQYLWQNQTRLQEAQDLALWLIRQLPPDSEVAVVDSRPGGAVFAVDLSAALRSIERLETAGMPLPLTSVVDQAVELAAASRKARREVYVFSDLTAAAWTAESPAALQRRLAEASDVLLYVLDVGRDDPQNTALGELQLSDEILPQSSDLAIQGEIECVGAGGTRTVELHLEQIDLQMPLIQDGTTLLPEPQLRDKQLIQLEADGGQTFRFQLRGLDLGTHQGWVKIAGQDALAWDDTRYFTVEVQEASPVLVLAPPGVNTKFFTEAVAPYEFRQTGRAPYACSVFEQAQLQNLILDDYSAVCLLDPLPLTPPDWDKLGGYMRRGGGLGIFLGHNADPAPFNVAAATPVLGGRLVRQWRSAGDVFLAPRDLNHPVTAAFREIATAVPWQQFPVHRHWVMEDFAEQARLVIPYSNNQPAVIETSLERGRGLTMTTPVSDPLQLQGRQPWNELPTGSDAWPYLVLVNEMLAYLVDTAGIKLNYLVGETAVLPNNPDRHPERYQLFTPLGPPQEAVAADGRIVVRYTEYSGAYRLKGNRGGPVVRGFCVNFPKSASRLERIGRERLNEVLGLERYHFARNRDEIVLGIGQARMGFEFYPWLICLVALVLAMEQLLANRFYRRTDG